MVLASFILFALTRAEFIQRLQSPAITQADGLVKVYAHCDEDIRREYQGPVGSFASDTIQTLYRVQLTKSRHFDKPGIMIFLGNERTNNTEVVSTVTTNDTRLITRIYLKSPGFCDLETFRRELTRGFYRSVKNTEISEEKAEKILKLSDPKYRLALERKKVEAWLSGNPIREEGVLPPATEEEFFAETEAELVRYRKVLEPGVASRRDVLTFASRLRLYPRAYDEKFVGGADVLTFSEAIALAPKDPRVRILAHFKANEMSVFAGGRGEYLMDAAEAYVVFLNALARGEKSPTELESLLALADTKLKVAAAHAE